MQESMRLRINSSEIDILPVTNFGGSQVREQSGYFYEYSEVA